MATKCTDSLCELYLEVKNSFARPAPSVSRGCAMLQTWTTLHVSAHITTILLKEFCTLPRNFSGKQTYFVNKVTKIQQKSYKNVPISFYVKIVVVDCHFIRTDPVIPQNDIRHSVWHLSPSGLAWIDANFLLTEARCLGESHPACADIFFLLPVDFYNILQKHVTWAVLSLRILQVWANHLVEMLLLPDVMTNFSQTYQIVSPFSLESQVPSASIQHHSA